MARPEIELPDDVDALKAMVLAMAEKAARVEALEKQVDDLEARNADADERIERLTQILKAFDRARFGRRSEKPAAASVDDEQHAFVFEEIETGIAAISEAERQRAVIPLSRGILCVQVADALRLVKVRHSLIHKGVTDLRRPHGRMWDIRPVPGFTPRNGAVP